MNFKIDRQTLDELNLLGKFRQGTVYYLFNQAKTQGGEQLLDEMFRNPLTDAVQINKRSAIFQYFQEEKIEFAFDSQQIAAFREFLDTKTFRNAPFVLLDVFSKKVLADLTRDERYKNKIQGLHATILVLRQCAEMLSQFSRGDSPFKEQLLSMEKLLADPQLVKLKDIDIYQDLPVKTIANYEHLIKGKLSDAMEAVLHFIYHVDVYIAVSDVAVQKGFSYGKAFSSEKNVLQCKNLRHPCIPKAIGNDLLLNDKSNLLFLTGANMAGKSTWMKSLGIGIYMAHMGFPIAADEFEFSVRDGFYSSINVADNISLGYSHFYAEVIRVKTAAEATASGQRLILMFDELFKGTNVKDAYDGTLAVTEGFADYENCLFVISTHIIEVGEALKKFPNIQFRYMPTYMDGAVPRYTFTLQEGITEDRQGMMIIRNEGILELIESA